MKKCVEQFVKYLEEEKKAIEKSKPKVKLVSLGKDITDIKFTDFPIIKTSREKEIDFILTRITMSDEEYLKHMELFHHFKDLSRYMEAANLFDQEKFDLIMYMVRRNLKCITLSKQNTAINDIELKNFKFPGISSKKIADLISTGEINRIINGQDKELTDYEIKIRDIILNNVASFSTDIKKLVEQHNNIKAHYFEKEDTFDKADIDIVVNSLKELTFSDKICNIVHQTLNKYLRNRISMSSLPLASEVVIEPITVVDPEPTPKEEEQECALDAIDKSQLPMTYKEQKNIYRKIREYYDIPKGKIIKNVNLNEMIEIVSLMLKINIELKSIRAYIRPVLKSLEETNDPAIKYQTFKNKLAYYLSKEQMAYLDELYIAFQDDRDLWMDEFMLYLDTVMQSIFDTYNYELEQAKQLIKIENGN